MKEAVLELKDCASGAAKVIIEKSCSGIFLWNRNCDLGWIWAKWPTFLPSWLQNLLTYETIIYLKKVPIIFGTFWGIKNKLWCTLFRTKIKCHCDYIMAFGANSFFIFQMHHEKIFKIRYIKAQYKSFWKYESWFCSEVSKTHFTKYPWNHAFAGMKKNILTNNIS